MRIIEHYAKLDKKLFNIMLTVNGEYETINPNETTNDDVIVLLYYLEDVVKHIQENYGDVLKKN